MKILTYRRAALRHLFRSRLSFAVALFICCFAPAQESAIAEPFSNPVVPGATLGPYRHGTFPALPDDPWCKPFGGCTHVGVDLLIPEGCPSGYKVYAFADGTVQQTVTEGRPEYAWAGNAVLVYHPSSLLGVGRPAFFTLYLHMRNVPLVAVNTPVVGGKTVLGEVGKTGAAGGRCHTHFEIRQFADLIQPAWKNIYGQGDRRTDLYFKLYWVDPLPMFEMYPLGLTEEQAKAQREKLAAEQRRREAAQKSAETVIKVPEGQRSEQGAPSPLPSATTGALPTYYGVFVSSAGKLYELRPELAETETLFVTPAAQWPSCCRNQNIMQVSAGADVELLVFLRGLSHLDISLFQMHFVRWVLRFDMELREEKRLRNVWAKGQDIPTTQAPITGRPEMIRVAPREWLRSGIYGIRIGSEQGYPKDGVLVFGLQANTSERAK